MNTIIHNQPILCRSSAVVNSTPKKSSAPDVFADAATDLEMSALMPDVALISSQQEIVPAAPRHMRPWRFGTGLMLTTIGMGIILLIAVSMLEIQPLWSSSAYVAVGILSAVMLLGGGFGLMVTASSGFDEQEFDRLMTAGNIASAEMAQRPADESAVSSDIACPMGASAGWW